MTHRHKKKAYDYLSLDVKFKLALDKANGAPMRVAELIKYANLYEQNRLNGKWNEIHASNQSYIYFKLNKILSSITYSSALLDVAEGLSRSILCPRIVKLFLDYGANPHSRYNNGSILHDIASQFTAKFMENFLTSAELFAAHGVSAHQLDDRGRVAFDLIQDSLLNPSLIDECSQKFVVVTKNPRIFSTIVHIDPNEVLSDELRLTEDDENEYSMYLYKRYNQIIRMHDPDYSLSNYFDCHPIRLSDISAHLNSTTPTTTTRYSTVTHPIPTSRCTEIKKKSEVTIIPFADKHKTLLNGTQQRIVEAVFVYIFSGLRESLSFSQYNKILSIMLGETTVHADFDIYKEKDVMPIVQQYFEIIDDDYPQNRAHGSGQAYLIQALNGRDPVTHSEFVASSTGVYQYAKTKTVYFFNYNNNVRTVGTEPLGKLGLTARKNHPNESISKESTVHYIKCLVKEEKCANHIQFWYRRTRDENKALVMLEKSSGSVLKASILKRRA